jgi:signal transduction histidine kinase
LSAVVGARRFDLGFYAGRIFGLVAASFLLGALLVEMNKLYGELADAFDMAEKRHAELTASREQLARAQRNEAIGQLTGGVAHDFNNLLTVVTGSLDMMARDPENSARVARLARAGLEAAKRGERLTHQLLTFARRQVSRPETVNANKLLADFESLLQRAAGDDFRIVMKLDPELVPVRVDIAQFEAAVLNLVANARDAMPNGGDIVVETSNTALDTRAAAALEIEPGDYVVVAVSDRGIGMSAEVTARAFDPFFTTKDVGRGTGMGLSQVFGAVRNVGGQARIYSEPGIGTTVKLYLPKATGQARPTMSEVTMLPVREARGGEVVLVVEDDPGVLQLAVEGLSDLGYAVLTATHAAEALDIVRGGHRIDVLFSDVIMPGGMNGAQLAVEARRIRPALKVLLTSGYTASALTLQHGMPENLELLGKPYRREDLADKLRLVMNG